MRVALEALDAPGRRAEDGERGAGLGGLRGVGEDRGGRGRGGDETQEEGTGGGVGGVAVGARKVARRSTSADPAKKRATPRGGASGATGGTARGGRTSEERRFVRTSLDALLRNAAAFRSICAALLRMVPEGDDVGRRSGWREKDVRKRGRREGLPATREGRNGRPAPRRPTPRARSVRRGSRRSVAPRARFQSSRSTPPRARVVAFDDGPSRPAVVPRGFGQFFSSSPSSRLLHRRFFNPSILGSLAPRSPPARANQRRA